MDTKKLFYEVVKKLQTNGDEHCVEILEDEGNGDPLIAAALFGSIIQLEDKILIEVGIGLSPHLTAQIAWSVSEFSQHVVFQNALVYFCEQCDAMHEGPDALVRYAKDLVAQAEEMGRETDTRLN